MSIRHVNPENLCSRLCNASELTTPAREAGPLRARNVKVARESPTSVRGWPVAFLLGRILALFFKRLGRLAQWHPVCTNLQPHTETPPDKSKPVVRRGRKATGQGSTT